MAKSNTATKHPTRQTVRRELGQYMEEHAYELECLADAIVELGGDVSRFSIELGKEGATLVAIGQRLTVIAQGTG